MTSDEGKHFHVYVPLYCKVNLIGTGGKIVTGCAFKPFWVLTKTRNCFMTIFSSSPELSSQRNKNKNKKQNK